ncbi:hypothetical protein ACJX0J_012002 [Zea mays]
MPYCHSAVILGYLMLLLVPLPIWPISTAPIPITNRRPQSFSYIHILRDALKFTFYLFSMFAPGPTGQSTTLAAVLLWLMQPSIFNAAHLTTDFVCVLFNALCLLMEILPGVGSIPFESVVFLTSGYVHTFHWVAAVQDASDTIAQLLSTCLLYL